MPDLKPVGVQLIAENGEQYVATLNQAATAEKQLTDNLIAGAPMWQQMALQMSAQDVSAKQIVQTLTQWGVSEDEVTKFLQQNGIALQEDTQAITANAEAQRQLGGNIATTGGMMREGRLLIGAMTAEMALMTLTAGDTLPLAMREAAKGIQEVTMMAMMGFIAFGPWGALAGAVVGGLLYLATTAGQASPEIQALNKELDNLGKKDDAAAGLAELTGLTLADAEAALKAAKNNLDLADSITKAAQAKEATKEDHWVWWWKEESHISAHLQIRLLHSEKPPPI